MRILLLFLLFVWLGGLFADFDIEKEPDIEIAVKKRNSKKRVKRFLDLAITEFAGLITCCKDASFYPSTCSFKAELSKLGNRLAVTEEIIKPLVEHQAIVKDNLHQIKRFLENLRSRLPILLKYSDTYFNLIPVIIQGFQKGNSFKDIQKMLEKSLEAEIMEGVTKSLAAVEAIILIADPTKLSVAITVVFSVVGLVMNIVSQKKENARLGKQLAGVEDQWAKMEAILQIVSDSSRDLEKNWNTIEQTANVYGRNLSQAYIHLQNLLPYTFTRQLPGTYSDWTPRRAVVSIRNWDDRYKISPRLDPIQIINDIFQLEVNTNRALQIKQEVEEFLEDLEHDFEKIFSKYLSGTSAAQTLSTNDKLLLLKTLGPAINEKVNFAELLKRSRKEGLNVDRTSLFKILSNMMKGNKCYGLYPLDLVRAGQNHFIFNVDISQSTIAYIQRKTTDQDYSVDTLVRKLKRRHRSFADQWNRKVVLYILSALYPSTASYMGEDLGLFRICTLSDIKTPLPSYLRSFRIVSQNSHNSSHQGTMRRIALHLTLRKYQEVYDEDYQGCKWRIEAGSNTTSLSGGIGTLGQRHNAWAMVGHDILNIHGDVETGHRQTYRSDTDWAKARGGYKVGELNHDGKVGASTHIADNGIHVQAEAGTNLNIHGDLVQIGVGSKAEHKSYVDVGQGIDFSTGIGVNAKYQILGEDGPEVGFGISSGLGVSGGLNPRDNNVGGSVLTPAGSFGAHVGCKTKVCFFGCVTINIC